MINNNSNSNNKSQVGVIHGRFQPLHLGHMEYLLSGKARCNHLIIGITNPDPLNIKTVEADKNRSRIEANPFTYFERYLMLKESLQSEGIKQSEFDIVPFPINNLDLLQYYVPLDSVFYLTIYDEWGIYKMNAFKKQKLQTEIMWTRKPEDKITSGTKIRKLIREKLEWRNLVPIPVANIIDRIDLSQRII